MRVAPRSFNWLLERLAQALCAAAGELGFATPFARGCYRAGRNAPFRGLDLGHVARSVDRLSQARP
jgi:hypothetical protein